MERDAVLNTVRSFVREHGAGVDFSRGPTGIFLTERGSTVHTLSVSRQGDTVTVTADGAEFRFDAKDIFDT